MISKSEKLIEVKKADIAEAILAEVAHIKTTKGKVRALVTMGFANISIARALNIESSRVSNIKAEMRAKENKML